MFVLKKILTLLVMPVSLALLLLLIALLIRRTWLSKSLIVMSVLLLGFCSSHFGSNALLEPLEQQYPVNNSAIHGSCTVVVLGSGHNDSIAGPGSQQLSAIALKRLYEGVRQWHLGDNCQLVVSGAASNGNQVAHAEVMALTAIELGIPSGRIIKLPNARDTIEEAMQLKQLGNINTIRLVTSASHLPRAVTIYQQQGFTVEPAPTDIAAHDGYWWRLDAENLYNSQRAIHEYVGMFWLSLKNKLH